MAVVENAGVKLGKSVGSNSANQNPETSTTPQNGGAVTAPNDQDLSVMVTSPPQRQHQVAAAQRGSFEHVVNHHHQRQRSNDGDFQMSNGDHHHDVDRDMKKLFSKLNPIAEEFVPPSLANGHGLNAGFVNMALMMQNRNRNGQANGFPGRQKNQRMSDRFCSGGGQYKFYSVKPTSTKT
ncbi:hypothetical protein ACFX1S_019787 [Malus domestica]